MLRKTICITGAAKGIGRAIAKVFGDGSYNLALNTGSDKEGLQSLVEELSGSCSGEHILTHVGDVGNSAYVHEFMTAAKEKFGHIDILINNAGIAHIGLLSDMTDEEWKRLMDTNLNAVFYTCREVIPDMVHTKSGKIINISSMWGTVGASCEVAYSATKGAVNAFTKALAKELAPSNIQVNALSCGVIDTAMNGCFSPEEKEDLADEIPVGRFGDPMEVGLAVKKMIEMPEYVTGQILTIDGGYI
ncbi:MAG: SDR family NAD(P)-dependent oxidoreductase [Lachnospiraceae bacterium]|nr:SDR family NAD(P)-dependent oxidoreductase [Lachnospiraceae bacterium]